MQRVGGGAAFGAKVCQSGAHWIPISIKNRLKLVSGIHLPSVWLPDPPQCAVGFQKGTNNGKKSMILQMR